MASASHAHNKVRRATAIQDALGYNFKSSSALGAALGSNNAVLRDYRGRAVNRDGHAVGGQLGFGAAGDDMLDAAGSGPQDADGSGAAAFLRDLSSGIEAGA